MNDSTRDIVADVLYDATDGLYWAGLRLRDFFGEWTYPACTLTRTLHLSEHDLEQAELARQAESAAGWPDQPDIRERLMRLDGYVERPWPGDFDVDPGTWE